MSPYTLRRSIEDATVRAFVDGQALTGWVSEAQALAAVREHAGWRGAIPWRDDAAGIERVIERVGGPRTTRQAQRANAAVVRVLEVEREAEVLARLGTEATP